jgi:hypothetical protein
MLKLIKRGVKFVDYRYKLDSLLIKRLDTYDADPGE